MTAAPGAFEPEHVARLAALGLAGEFEAHITVAATSDAAAFAAICSELGVGCIAIELGAGDHTAQHAAQAMTASRHRGTLAAAVAEVEAVHAALVARGFAIARVKLEADATLVDSATGRGYFEYHVELQVSSGGDVSALAALVAAHGGRLSRNARRAGRRFATLRVYGASRCDAEARVDALIAALVAGGHTIASCAREYALYDSRIELDAGWLEPE